MFLLVNAAYNIPTAVCADRGHVQDVITVLAAQMSFAMALKIRSITLPLPPIASIPPYSAYSLAGTGLECSRRRTGSQCGAQEHVDCSPFANLGPVTQGAGTSFFLPPSDPVIITMVNSTQYLTFARWTVYDVGTGGAKVVGVYGSSSVSQQTAPVVVAHEWQPNGKIANVQGSNTSYFCGACTNCEVGKGVKVMEVLAGYGLGFRSIELSQLYDNVACGASCFDLDASYFTGMEYSCVMKRTCEDVDPVDAPGTRFECPTGYTNSPTAADSSPPSPAACCIVFVPTCGNQQNSNPAVAFDCAALGLEYNSSASNLPAQFPKDLLTCCKKPAVPKATVDVSITKNALPPIGDVNSNFKFTVTVEASALPNQKPAENVIMRDVLPEFFILIDAVARPDDPNDQACELGLGVVTCFWPQLKPGDVKVITITAKATVAGSYINTAVVTTTSDDEDTSNNRATAEVKVRAPAATSALENAGRHCRQTVRTVSGPYTRTATQISALSAASLTGTSANLANQIPAVPAPPANQPTRAAPLVNLSASPMVDAL
eukprot:gene14327-53_t